MAEFLVFAGLAENAVEARSHPGWDGWLPHRTALSWPYQDTAEPGRALSDLQAINNPVLLFKGTRSEPWLRRTVDVLRDHLPRSNVVELEGAHAAHIESIDRFIEDLEKHLHQTF